MRQKTITLENETPVSLNKFYAGMHWSKRKGLADLQHMLVRSQIDPNFPPFSKPVDIEFFIYYPDKRKRDIDNATVKMYIDGLIPHVLEGDDYRYIKSVKKVYEYDKERPRVEIHLSEVGNDS